MSTMDPLSAAVRRGWWLPLVAALGALLVTAGMTARQEPRYRARALLAVAPNSNVEGTDDILDSIENLERRSVVATLARIPSSSDTLERAATRLDVPPRELRGYRSSGSVAPNTNLVQIEVDGPNPARTAALAAALAEQTQQEGRALYRIYSLRLLDAPAEPSRPISPNWKRNMAQAVLLGLFFGALGAFAIELVRGRARTAAG